MSENKESELQWFEVHRVVNGWVVRSHSGGWDPGASDTKLMHVFTDAGALAAWVLEQTGGKDKYEVLSVCSYHQRGQEVEPKESE